MSLVFLAISCLLLGSSSGTKFESVCYGKSVALPHHIIPPDFARPLYFSPSDGGPRKLLMDNGKVLDPRIKVSPERIYITELTEKDDGMFLIPVAFGSEIVLKLEILDCTKQFTRLYGHTLEYDVPEKAEFLEFNPIHSLDESMILWNRSDPQVNVGKRGQVKRNVFRIFRPTQADNGYYSFRQEDNTLESKLNLTVKENQKYADEKEDARIFISYPWTGGPWTVTYNPKHGYERITVIKEGFEIWQDSHRFSGRIYDREKGIEISFLEYDDSGSFEFRDPEGYLALIVHLNVISESTNYSGLVSIALGIAGLVVFGCCSFCFVKKCCIDTKFPTRTPVALRSYTPDVDQTAINPRTSNAQNSSSYRPTSTSFQPQVAPPAHQVSVPAPSSSCNFLSSDTEPRFELKGLNFPSAALLSSDTPSSDVYTSDKLNFL